MEEMKKKKLKKIAKLLKPFNRDCAPLFAICLARAHYGDDQSCLHNFFCSSNM